MPRVYIVQCLCPSRHCMMGLAYEEGRQVGGAGDLVFHNAEEACAGLKVLIEHFIKDGQINPWCHLCQSRDWHYEVGVTRFTSLKEAQPHLARLEFEQLITQIVHDMHGLHRQN